MCHGCAEHPELAQTCRDLAMEARRRVYLFHDLPPELVASLLEGSTEQTFETDQWIAFAGEAARHFHLVLRGEIGLLHQSDEGDEFIVALLGPGELFGEDSALTREARHTLSARALSPSRVACFDRRRLHELLPRDPRLFARLLETLQRRNTILLEEIERVTVQTASERLLTFLSRQRAPGLEKATRLPKRILASRLAIRPETLSRVLARLKACRHLEEKDGCLFLTDLAEEAGARCALCPGRLWGCPGRVGASALLSEEA